MVAQSGPATAPPATVAPPATTASSHGGSLLPARIVQSSMARHGAAAGCPFSAVQCRGGAAVLSAHFSPVSDLVPLPPAASSATQSSPCISVFICLNKSKISYLGFITLMALSSPLEVASVIKLPVLAQVFRSSMASSVVSNPQFLVHISKANKTCSSYSTPHSSKRRVHTFITGYSTEIHPPIF